MNIELYDAYLFRHGVGSSAPIRLGYGIRVKGTDHGISDHVLEYGGNHINVKNNPKFIFTEGPGQNGAVIQTVVSDILGWSEYESLNTAFTNRDVKIKIKDGRGHEAVYVLDLVPIWGPDAPARPRLP